MSRNVDLYQLVCYLCSAVAQCLAIFGGGVGFFADKLVCKADFDDVVATPDVAQSRIGGFGDKSCRICPDNFHSSRGDNGLFWGIDFDFCNVDSEYPCKFLGSVV